jgi:hypothetical protein
VLVGCTEDHSEEVQEQEEQTVQVAKIDTSEVDRFFKSVKKPILTSDEIDSLVRLLLKTQVPKTVRYIDENNLEWMFYYLYFSQNIELPSYSYAYNQLSLYEEQIWENIDKKVNYESLNLSQVKALINIDVYADESPQYIGVHYGNLLRHKNSIQVIKLLLAKSFSSPEWLRVEILFNFIYLSDDDSKRVTNILGKEIEDNINTIEETYNDDTLVLKIMTLIWAKKYNLVVKDQIIEKCLLLISKDIFNRNCLKFVNSEDEFNAGVNNKEEFLRWFKNYQPITK